jgi:hypothetical protein
MAVIKKTLFPKNLEKFAVLVDDTQSDSKYFKITELPGTFTGGKNAFLIAGSDFLVPDTKIQIELKDSAGNIIYHEPGEGMINTNISGSTNTSIITEYYEGVSKVVAVYVYPDTAYGPCTLTILGELSEYQDTNGITLPVPLDWENKYNVKWTKTINVNPALANTTKIRFYQRPVATITEILSPIYRIESGSKVDSGINQSFANIKLSKLETFAGDVKRVKVFRTSEGDISDFDLIQDILVESKELLTSYGLSGSVVGQTGILTSETLKNNWNTGSLNTFITSSRVESGVRLTGSGYFTYTQSLDIKSSNTYELNLDAFYSSSTSSNLGIYLTQLTSSIQEISPGVSGSVSFYISSSIATLVGTTPTKNLLDTVIPFRIDRDYPSASLYFSQSQGEWHLGNISLRLSEDTAFSPDEVSFVTTMPTVIGNETYNFKFEFYDVNNNYVPVAVTQSATFNGGNTNIGGTILLISSSASSSLADLNRVSSSISGTMTVYSSSASSSVGSLSGSVSASLSSLSSSVSSSNVFILSSSLSKVQQLANGQFSGSFIGDTFIYSPTIGGQQGYISELFKVGTTPSIYLDARQNPRKIFIGGVSDSGSYNNSNTTVYMDSTGKFSLGNKLTWDGNSTLTVTGQINIEAGGNAATTTNVSTAATNAVTSGSNAAANAVISGSNAASAVDDKVFTNALGRITKTPTPGTTSGLYLGNTIMGFYNGSAWKTYMDNTGLFYLTGSNNGNALLWDGSTLTIKGNLSVGSTVPNSVVSGLGSLALKSSVSATTDVTGLGSLALKSSVSATTDVTGLGGLATKSSVTNAELADLAVTSGKLDALAVTSGKIAADAVIAGKIAADAVTSTTIAANAITAGKIAAGVVTADKITVGDLTGLNAKIGGWSINSSSIFNTNVDIDNANNRIDFKSGGIVKTRIKNGNVNIGSTSNVSITVAGAGTQFQSNEGNDSPQYGPLTALTTTGGNTVEAFVTTPSGVDGNNLALVIPYPAVTSLGLAQCHNMGTGASCQYGYDASIFYVVRETNSVGTTVASGYVTVANLEFSNNFTSPFGNVDLPGFGGGTVTIPSIGTAVSGKVYWIQVYLGTVVQARINPNGTTPLTSNASLYVIAFGWEARTANATLLAVASRAEFGTNGVQIGSAEGSYVALGDAAGAGNVGVFAGNISVTGTVAAGSVTASDIRAKTNIKTILNGIETIKKLNPVSYDWLQHITGNFEFEKGYGFIADDIQQIMPELIYEKKGYKYDDFKHLDYTSFHAIAIKAIQELTEKVEKLEAQISGSI